MIFCNVLCKVSKAESTPRGEGRVAGGREEEEEEEGGGGGRGRDPHD